MSETAEEVAQLNWGTDEFSGTTDTFCLKLIEQSNQDLMLALQDMEHETKKCLGVYDLKLSVHIAANDRTQLIALLLAHVWKSGEPLSWDELLERCNNLSVPFVMSDRAIT